jgi:hypothetical protein
MKNTKKNTVQPFQKQMEIRTYCTGVTRMYMTDKSLGMVHTLH